MRVKRVNESDNFPLGNNHTDSNIKILTDTIDKSNKSEFGSIEYIISKYNKYITFNFNKDITEDIEWGIENITDDFLNTRSNISGGFVGKIVGLNTNNLHFKDKLTGDYYLPIEFSVLNGKSPIVILHTSSVIDEDSDITIVLKDGVDISKIIFEELDPVFAWIKLCKKLHEFNRLDEDTLKDVFSDAFDDAEDYSIVSTGTIPTKYYEIAISTKTKRDGGYVDIDDDVMKLLMDIANVREHLSEYSVDVSFNTTRPNADRFPDKNDTFYKSQAIIIRIVPKNVV